MTLTATWSYKSGVAMTKREAQGWAGVLVEDAHGKLWRGSSGLMVVHDASWWWVIVHDRRISVPKSGRLFAEIPR